MTHMAYFPSSGPSSHQLASVVAGAAHGPLTKAVLVEDPWESLASRHMLLCLIRGVQTFFFLDYRGQSPQFTKYFLDPFHPQSQGIEDLKNDLVAFESSRSMELLFCQLKLSFFLLVLCKQSLNRMGNRNLARSF